MPWYWTFRASAERYSETVPGVGRSGFRAHQSCFGLGHLPQFGVSAQRGGWSNFRAELIVENAVGGIHLRAIDLCNGRTIGRTASRKCCAVQRFRGILFEALPVVSCELTHVPESPVIGDIGHFRPSWVSNL